MDGPPQKHATFLRPSPVKHVKRCLLRNGHSGWFRVANFYLTLAFIRYQH